MELMEVYLDLEALTREFEVFWQEVVESMKDQRKMKHEHNELASKKSCLMDEVEGYRKHVTIEEVVH